MIAVYPFNFDADLPTTSPAPGYAALYGLTDPRDKALRYIGKSIAPVARLQVHRACTRSRQAKTPLGAWKRQLFALGLVPDMRVLAWLPAAQLDEMERAYIREGRAAGYRLLNCAEGGEGGRTLSPEGYKAMGAERRGRPMSPTAYEKLVALNKRKAADPAFREKLLAALQRREANPDFAAARAERMQAFNAQLRASGVMHAVGLKRWQDHPEMRCAISAASKRNWQDPDFRERMTERTRAAWQDPTYRAHMEESNRQRWADPVFRAQRMEQLTAQAQDASFRAAVSAGVKRSYEENPSLRDQRSQTVTAYWADPDRRAAMGARLKALHADPVWHARWLEAYHRARCGKSPSPETRAKLAAGAKEAARRKRAQAQLEPQI